MSRPTHPPLALSSTSSLRVGLLPVWLWPTLLSALLLLPFLGRRSSLDGHEVLVAQTAREMLHTGDWILPRFSGELRLQKPPLAYWLTALSYRLIGRVDEFAARLPSALATIAGIAGIAWAGASLFDRTIGLHAAIIHATTFWVIAYGKSALVDAILAALVAAAVLLSAYDRLDNTTLRPAAAIVLFWISCGLVVLAKGPTGLGVIIPTVILYRVLRARSPQDRPLLLHWATLPALAIFAILALAWPLSVQARAPEAAALWYAQSAGRYLEHWGPNTRPWFYYLYMAPALTLPWAPAWIAELAGSISDRWSGRRLDDGRLLLWIWFAVALLFFSLSAGKREHYILPGLTPLSLLAALGLRRVFHKRTSRRSDPGSGDDHKARSNPTLTSALCEKQTSRSRTSPSPPSQNRQVAGAPDSSGERGRGEGFFEGRSRVAYSLALAASVLFAAIVSTCLGVLQVAAPAMTLAIGLSLITAAHWLQDLDNSQKLATFVLSLATAILVVETTIVPTFHWRSGVLAMLDRQRETLDRAERVLQFGSNDHWIIFPVDRPMAWPRTLDDLKRELVHAKSSLVLVPEHRLAEVTGVTLVEVVDRVGDDRSPAERDRRLDLVLVRPVRQEDVDR